MDIQFKDWYLKDDRVVQTGILFLFKREIFLYDITACNCILRSEGSAIYIKATNHMVSDFAFSFEMREVEKAMEAFHYISDHSAMSEEGKRKAHKDILNMTAMKIEVERLKKTGAIPKNPTSPKKENKDASVVGRAVVGGIVAGPAGAVVGALSAVDKNNRNKNENHEK